MANELKLYLPVVLRDIKEYEELSNAETPFLAELEQKTEQIVEDSFLSTMSPSRLEEWENALGIIPTTESVEQRRSVVLSRFRGTGKLNKTLIQAMVKAFTGGGATITFADGILQVSVTPPSSTFQDFSVDKLTEELLKRKPAHLLLNVELAYINWGLIKDNLTSWEDLSASFSTWNDVFTYYVTQEGYSLWH